MRTKLEVLDIFRLEKNMKPKMELTLHDLNMHHRSLIHAWSKARELSDIQHRASMAASRATQSSYIALSEFELMLQDFADKHNLEGMERFKLVTVDPEDGGEERA